MKMKMEMKILASLGEGALRNIRPPPTFNEGRPYGTIHPPPYGTLGALRLIRVKEYSKIITVGAIISVVPFLVLFWDVFS